MSTELHLPDTRMNTGYALKFAGLALAHVTREFPNKLDHVLTDVGDVHSPRELHPIFFGSFDWHSCVHGYWLLARVLHGYPHIAEAAAIRALFDAQLTDENVAVETAYAAHSARGGFERPYGWAWLLMLQAALLQQETVEGARWARALQPLADVFVARFRAFLPNATYPVRVGTHYNTSFAIVLAIEYAQTANDPAFRDLLTTTARGWYSADVNAAAWEPSGDDFLSSTLMEAECMRLSLTRTEFSDWLSAFLPNIAQQQPASLFTPATVSDRSDGKTAHLDGLNFSRAWCWRTLASTFASHDARKDVVLGAATAHLQASLDFVAGDYAGEHWLATFALLALEARG